MNIILVCCAMSVTGCATTTLEKSDVPQEQEAVKLPFQPPKAPLKELDSAVVFSALVGEIAAQRGDLRVAYQHQMQTALLSGDAASAERATRIALVMKQKESAFRAVQEWVRLAPNDLAARQLAVTLFLDDGQKDQAWNNILAIMAITESTGQDGFLNVVTALSKTHNRAVGMSLMNQLAMDYPQDPMSGYGVAMLALVWKQYDLAESTIREVIDDHRDFVKGHILLSRVLVARGDKPGAIRVLEKAAAGNSDESAIQFALAQLYVDSGEYKKAYGRFIKVKKLTPDDPGITYSLGVLAMQLDNLQAARKHFMELLKAGEMVSETSYYLGRIEEQNERFESAIDYYSEVEKGEFHYEAQIRIVRILADQGRVAEARGRVQNLRAEMPEYSVQLFLAEAELVRKQGDDPMAMRLYNRGIEVHPDDISLLYARALFAVSIGKLDILEQDLSKVLELDPDNVDALNALGYTLADQTNRYAEAGKYIGKALELKPEEPAILDSMGWLKFRLGKNDEALVYLEKAMEKLPDAEIAAHLGEVLWVTGHRERALEIWEGALGRNPDSQYLRRTMQRLIGK
ncbi:MAG: tetratricopeptide repeat protein [Gammaproteobacteria bacterium]|nr:tetratricopeptide repeat protein [Gammaproteobacteria bacterium]